MGKRAKAQRHVAKMAAKKAAKATRRALYESLRGTGKNKKRKTGNTGGTAVKPLALVQLVVVTLNGFPSLAQRKVHGGPECRNVGCKRCSRFWKLVVDNILQK